MDSFVRDERKDWPDREGRWWFYGYRYGKVSCGREVQPEVYLCDVRKVSNGLMVVAEGQFMYETEVEKPNFIRATLPELMDI